MQDMLPFLQENIELARIFYENLALPVYLQDLAKPASILHVLARWFYLGKEQKACDHVMT